MGAAVSSLGYGEWHEKCEFSNLSRSCIFGVPSVEVCFCVLSQMRLTFSQILRSRELLN